MTVTINIDGKSLRVENRGSTILQAAQKNLIYIPTLCSHKELVPYGGCRLCLVEIEGARRLMTACTTPVEGGQVIRTNTPQVRALRQDILRLILSEHPIGCLVCEERSECADCMGSIRKAGVTTGCGTCPKDGMCELQTLVKNVGLPNITYPMWYRFLKVEKYDPFYDRDYNLCVLCGRCIQACEKNHFYNAITFKQRGSKTVVGPAFGRSHLESGCDFCGACVAICPTGTLTEKARKWDGLPDGEVQTTCAFCAVGCQMNLLTKKGQVIGSLPVDDPWINHGQLCVKGRFGVTEMVNHFSRMKTPWRPEGKARIDLQWEEAIELAVEKLKDCPAAEFGMLFSPNLSNEDLYVGQKFTRMVMGSHNMTTTARAYYGNSFAPFLKLLGLQTSMDDLRQADLVLAVDYDPGYAGAVIEATLVNALSSGARLITINPNSHHLADVAERWVQVKGDDNTGEGPGMLEFLRALSASLEKAGVGTEAPEGVAAVADALKTAPRAVILVGLEILNSPDRVELLSTIRLLAEQSGAGIFAIPAQNNLVGSILMGAYSELLPGSFSTGNPGKIQELQGLWQAEIPSPTSESVSTYFGLPHQLKALYLVGEAAIPPEIKADFVIAENSHTPLAECQVDLALPETTFAEQEGTFIQAGGCVQAIYKAVEPPGQAKQGWEILSAIARKLGFSGFDYQTVSEIQHEIASLMPGFYDPGRELRPLAYEGEFLPAPEAAQKPVEHSYLGYPLTTWVEGLRMLFPVQAEKVESANPSELMEIEVK